MPKRLRKTDFAQHALNIVEQATGAPLSETDSTTDSTREDISRLMREMGRRGGMKGGAVRAARMSATDRSQAASLAARARWGKEKEKD